MITPVVTDKELAELLKATANYKMSREEYQAQRKSFVKGQVMMSNSSITEESFESIWNKLVEDGLVN